MNAVGNGAIQRKLRDGIEPGVIKLESHGMSSQSQ
jgi:hypothetical protein